MGNSQFQRADHDQHGSRQVRHDARVATKVLYSCLCVGRREREI